jgi:predicted nucleic acid-binding protein
LQQRGEHDALRAVAVMQQAKVVDFDSAMALRAARLSADFKLPIADSLIVATARMTNATIWTQDTHFEGLTGVRYVRELASWESMACPAFSMQGRTAAGG